MSYLKKCFGMNSLSGLGMDNLSMAYDWVDWIDLGMSRGVSLMIEKGSWVVVWGKCLSKDWGSRSVTYWHHLTSWVFPWELVLSLSVVAERTCKDYSLPSGCKIVKTNVDRVWKEKLECFEDKGRTRFEDTPWQEQNMIGRWSRPESILWQQLSRP